MDKRAKEQMTVVEQAINKERLDRAKKPETLQLLLDQDGWDDGRRGPFKSIFSMAYVMWEEGLGWRDPWFFTGFRFWRVDGLSRAEVSPSLNLRLAQNKLRPGCRYGALKGWFPLGPWQSLIDHLWGLLYSFSSTFHWKLPCVGFGFASSARNFFCRTVQSLCW